MILSNARVLTANGLVERNLAVEEGRIAGFTDAGSGKDGGWDLRGALVLPAIVDIHGDAFERQLQPRPGVDFPVALALAETERQLLANGIATAFHGVTFSWEPGLRGLDMWRALLAALDAGRFACDMRVHLRWEAFNIDAAAEAAAAIRAGQVDLLAFNDHTPSIVKKLGDAATAAKYAERAGMKVDAFRDVALAAAARSAEVDAARRVVSEAAREAGLPMASHDDATVEDRAFFRALGAGICEFPMAEAVAVAARDAGEAVVMGSPNVVRGRSHLGWASAAAMAKRGLCNVLASDYYYPCLLAAPFKLAADGMPLEQAWALVSANPAAAAHLADRGRIAPGLRADLIVVEVENGAPRLVATIVGGRLAWLAPGIEVPASRASVAA